MKALTITGYGNINDNTELMNVDKPKPEANEVLIEVYAAGVNPVDYKIIGGAFKQINPLNFPAPIGYDISGIVREVGRDVKTLSIGDEVYSCISGKQAGTSNQAGAFAEYSAVDSSLVVKKPANLSFEEAAGIPLVGETTVQAFELSGLKQGDKVLIHAGSGGVGTFAIQYAKAKGAYVYTTTSSHNVDWVKKLGADRVIDYKKENYLEIINEIDIVYDTLGGNYTAEGFKVLKSGGWVLSICGEIDNFTAKQFGFNGMVRALLAFKRRTLTKAMKNKNGFYRFLLMHSSGEQLKDISSLMEKGTIKPVVDKIFPLDEAKQALEYQKSGRAKGKIIISMK